MSSRVFVTVIATCLLLAGLATSAHVDMSKFKVNKSEVSVSGISSGGFMSSQVHVALSSKIKGAGVVAGGPYFCAADMVGFALTACMSVPSLIDMSALYDSVSLFESRGDIDSTKNLVNSPVYVLHGTGDTVVHEGVTKNVVAFYQKYKANVAAKFDIPAEHSFITNNYGSACNYLGSPFINNCGFDGAGAILNWIHGNLTRPTCTKQQNYVTFDQTQYTPGGASAASISLHKTGYAYIPDACQNGSTTPCKLHIALHGCNQQYSAIGTAFIEHAGYNGWAEANNIIVVYPQTAASYFFPYNPEGCFDWWGFTNAYYAVKGGPQIAFIEKIIDAFASS